MAGCASKLLSREPVRCSGCQGISGVHFLISTSHSKGHPNQQTPPPQTGGFHLCSSSESRPDTPPGKGEGICLFLSPSLSSRSAYPRNNQMTSLQGRNIPSLLEVRPGIMVFKKHKEIKPNISTFPKIWPLSQLCSRTATVQPQLCCPKPNPATFPVFSSGSGPLICPVTLQETI